MGFVFLVAFLSMFKTYRYTKTIQKMTNKLFYFLFIISAIVTVFMLHMKPYGVMLFGISTAYLLVRFSQIIKHKWIAEFIVFVILIASVVYNNYYMVSF
jgi:hypothetical protein